MIVTLPDLEPGRTYKRTELAHLVPEDDLLQATNCFPTDIECWPIKDIQLWRRDGEVLFEYTEMDIRDALIDIQTLWRDFERRPDHRIRVEKIKRLLETEKPAWPVFIQKNDPHKRIVEGRHRSVAMMELLVPRLPVLLSKYAD